jgi:hypothetical protein
VPGVSFQLPTGTVIDLLNALTTSANQVMWVAAYLPIGESERLPRLDLTLDLWNAEHLTG